MLHVLGQHEINEGLLLVGELVYDRRLRMIGSVSPCLGIGRERHEGSTSNRSLSWASMIFCISDGA